MWLHTTKHTFVRVGPKTLSVRAGEGLALPAGSVFHIVSVTTSARGVPCRISLTPSIWRVPPPSSCPPSSGAPRTPYLPTPFLNPPLPLDILISPPHQLHPLHYSRSFPNPPPSPNLTIPPRLSLPPLFPLSPLSPPPRSPLSLLRLLLLRLFKIIAGTSL